MITSDHWELFKTARLTKVMWKRWDEKFISVVNNIEDNINEDVRDSYKVTLYEVSNFSFPITCLASVCRKCKWSLYINVR